MNRSILVVQACFISSIAAKASESSGNLLSYYADVIEFCMGFTEDLVLNQIVPIYQAMKTQPEIRYTFFTLLIFSLVAYILSSINSIFKPKKGSSVQFVHGQDVPKDSKGIQKSIRLLRETVAQLKQQALALPQESSKASTVNPNPVVSPTLDPAIDARLTKSQQSIESLRQGLAKIVEFQSELQNTILLSQQEVAQDLLAMRQKQPSAAKKILNNSAHIEQSNAKSNKQQIRQDSSICEDLPTAVGENGDSNPPIHPVSAPVQEIHHSLPKSDEQQEEARPIFEQVNHGSIYNKLNPQEQSVEQQKPATTSIEQQSTPLGNNSAKPPTIASRPVPFGTRQPPGLNRGKPPMRQTQIPTGPVVMPPS